MIRRLIEAAQSSLQDAKLSTISNEGGFDLAYKAIMQLANAALQAKGYRVLTSKPGHHQLMLQALPLTIDLDKTTLILLDQLRKQRNAIDYSGDIVSDALTTEVIAQAETLLKLVQARLISDVSLEAADSEWIDPDDAPELTADDLKRGVWAIDGKVVSEVEGRVAFAKRIKENSEKLSSKKPQK
jgi:uncharacterized protein (UPF0332 family)